MYKILDSSNSYKDLIVEVYIKEGGIMKAKSSAKPSISILMSVYNTKEEYLRKAIESILTQSFTDYEFIIFNDCSDEKTTAILHEYQDARIRLVENTKNQGLTKNLNAGINLAKGKYIARMDADDISLPDRLKIQFSYMENHPDIDMLGGEILFEDIKSVYWRYFPQEWRQINLLFMNCGICHPAAFFRTEFLRKNEILYNEEYDKAQDYELWTRAFRVGKMDICHFPILFYRKHSGQISTNIDTSIRQKELDIQIRRNLFRELISNADSGEYEQLLNLDMEVLSADKLSNLFIRIVRGNEKKKIYSDYFLKNELALRWFWILRGVIPRVNTKDYWQGYWFRYLRTPKFWLYLIKNKFWRILCTPKKVRRTVEDIY